MTPCSRPVPGCDFRTAWVCARPLNPGLRASLQATSAQLTDGDQRARCSLSTVTEAGALVRPLSLGPGGIVHKNREKKGFLPGKGRPARDQLCRVLGPRPGRRSRSGRETWR